MTDEPHPCKTEGCDGLVFGDQTHCQACIALRRRHKQATSPTSSRRRFKQRERGIKKRRRR